MRAHCRETDPVPPDLLHQTGPSLRQIYLQLDPVADLVQRRAVLVAKPRRSPSWSGCSILVAMLALAAAVAFS